MSIVSTFLFIACGASTAATPPEIAPSREFALAQPFRADAFHGGFFVHDLNKDGRMDFVVSSEGHVGAYSHSGTKMWVWEGDIRLFEYMHHPSVIAGNLDGGDDEEVAFFLKDNSILVLNAVTGEEKYRLTDLGKPAAMAVANLRGLGDRDIVLQYDLVHLRAIQGEDGATIWETHEYKGIDHSPIRLADLDGDGRDEVAGAALIDHDGRLMHEWVYEGHHDWIDSMIIADIVPGGPLEVALAEQVGAKSCTVVVNPERMVWRVLNPWNWEDPDKLAVGNFDPSRPGLEIFNRSSGGDGTAPRSQEEPFAQEQGPWVLDAQGELIAKYYLNDTKPEWWTGRGLEEISRIDWDGSDKDYLAAKERHRTGAGAIVDAISGEFLAIFRTRALRLYVADIEGDSREEVIVLDESGTIKIFTNPEPNPHPPKPSLWRHNWYRRQKQNWDYYSTS